MSAYVTMVLATVLAGLRNERGVNQLDFGLFMSIGALCAAVYFYMSGNSPATFWHDMAILASAFRF